MADLSFYIDDETEEFVKDFCNKSGVDFNTLMVMYCKQIALHKRIPMSVSIQQRKQEPVDVKFDFIGRCDPSKLLQVLSDENEFIAATVLAALPCYKSSLILQNIHEERRQKIVELMINGITTSSELLDGIARHLYKRMDELETSDIQKLGGVDEFVEVINLMDRSAEKAVLAYLDKNKPDYAEEIKKRMFVFEDIVLLDDKSVQKFLREVDEMELTKALKMADEAVKEKILSNMSKEAADSVKEDMEFIGTLRQKDCEESQMKIVSIIRRMEECGEIIIARG